MMENIDEKVKMLTERLPASTSGPSGGVTTTARTATRSPRTTPAAANCRASAPTADIRSLVGQTCQGALPLAVPPALKSAPQAITEHVRRAAAAGSRRLFARSDRRSMSDVHPMFRVRRLPRLVDDVLAMRTPHRASASKDPALTPVREDYISGMASPTTPRPSPSQINADLQCMASSTMPCADH